MDSDIGRNKLKQAEIFELSKEYKIKYSLIEPNLQNGFEFLADSASAIIIEKKINMAQFDEQEFDKDLLYITDLYKKYETRFENATIDFTENKTQEISENQKVQIEEINKKMLDVLEQMGEIAKALKNLYKS